MRGASIDLFPMFSLETRDGLFTGVLEFADIVVHTLSGADIDLGPWRSRSANHISLRELVLIRAFGYG